MAKRYLFSSSRTGHTKNIRKQKPKFVDIAKDIIKVSDVVLQILDARFVEETRNIEMEDSIKAQGKKLICVLNKSDLVKVKERFEDIKPYVYVSSKTSEGIKDLRERIKNSVKGIDIDRKERAQVGIIGYPNTGKSSLINILTRKSSAKTAPEAGFTKGVQKIRFSPSIVILDTPGVIPESEYSHIEKSAIQKQVTIGARTVDKIKEPDLVLLRLMERYSKKLEKFYKIDSGGKTDVFIEKYGRKMHFLKKGDVVDEDRTSRKVIRDWQEGKIRL
jgi:ribosome biogenesis GTPase A